MLKEFKEFISKGNLVEIAVGLILALAFAGLVTSFTENLINPIIGAIFGQPNFDSLAFVLFLIIKAYNRAFPKKETPGGPTEIELLTEIRDALRGR
jgi:large conductance mechanosensitive channel